MPKDFYHLKRDNNPHREEAFTLSCLGKIHPASSADLLRCRGYLSGLIQDSLNSPDSLTSILIIGLTESGIIPALLMYMETLARNLDTSILYSTRRPLSGIAFKESHSHGPDHILPLPLFSSSSAAYVRGSISDSVRIREISPFKEIWIVEDEITSGNTVFNLMVQLCEYLDMSRVRVFAFADFRDSQQKTDFSLKTAMNNIECTVHTLNIMDSHSNTTGEHLLNIIDESKWQIPLGMEAKINNTKMAINNIRELEKNSLNFNNTEQNHHIKSDKASEIDPSNNWHLPEKRPALAIKSGSFINYDLWKLAPDKFSAEWIKSETMPDRTILAVGEAIDLAACFALADENIRFQQISLSPWKVDNISIFSRINFAGKYYLYNYERLKSSKSNPVFILCDPIDKDVEQEAIVKLGEYGVAVKPIFKPEFCKAEEKV